MSMTEPHVSAVHHGLTGAGKKLGPLPVWAWGAVLGLGVVAYMYFRNKTSGSTAASSTNDSGATAGTGSVLPDMTANDLGTPGDYTGQTTSGSSVGPTLDNATWLAQAVAYMVTQGKNPLTVSQALDRYLNGESLSWTQEQYVSAVVAKFGLPPQGVSSDSSLAPPPATSPVTEPPKNGSPPPTRVSSPLPKQAPKPAPKPAPHGIRWVPYMIRWGDTLTSIAERYHTSVTTLASHNHIPNPDKIYAGHVIQVPVS